jgi:very-short-patch-repair endonuclease
MDMFSTADPVHFRDALASGMTVGRLRSSRVQRHSRGVYASDIAVLDDLGTLCRVAELVGGGAIGGLAAAWWHGVLVLPPPRHVDVMVPHRERRRARPGIRYVSAELAAEDVCLTRGIRVTTPTRTALDIARTLPFTEATVQLDAMVHTGLVDLDAFRRRVTGLAGSRHIRRIRAVAEAVEPLAESPMETRLRLLLRRPDLPTMVAQHVVRMPSGAFVGRVDLAFPEYRVAVEYDGAHHREAATQTADGRRQNLLHMCDWFVVRFTGADVQRDPASVVSRVRGVLAVRGFTSVT